MNFFLETPRETKVLWLAQIPISAPVSSMGEQASHLTSASYTDYLLSDRHKTDAHNIISYQVLSPTSCSPAPPDSRGKGMGVENRKSFTLCKYQHIMKVIMCVSSSKRVRVNTPLNRLLLLSWKKNQTKPCLDSGHKENRNSNRSRTVKEIWFGSILTIFGLFFNISQATWDFQMEDSMEKRY